MNEVNNIPEGWVETTLGEIAKVQTGPFGSQLKNEQYIIGGTPVVTVEHIVDFKIKDFNYPSVTEEDAKRLSKYLLKEGDIVFTRVGSVDLSAYVNRNQDGWMFSSRMLSVRPSKEINSKFLSYFFQQSTFRNYLLKIAVGATMPSLNTSILKEIPVSYPSLSEQKSIAAILTSFDDKIELLQAQNKTLEELAQTIFKEWFAKYKVGDKLPDGWGVGKLSEFGKIICGKTPSKSNEDYFGNDIPFIKIPYMHNKVFILETTDNLSIEGAKSQNNKMLPKNSICISCIATVGLVSITTKKSQTNQQINSIIPNENYFREFLYFTLTKMKNYLNDLGSGGTATLNVNTSTFSNIELVKPKEDIIKDFHKLSNPIFEKVLQNNTQIQTLTKTRDALLPKLMSGEIRVKK